MVESVRGREKADYAAGLARKASSAKLAWLDTFVDGDKAYGIKSDVYIPGVFRTEKRFPPNQLHLWPCGRRHNLGPIGLHGIREVHNVRRQGFGLQGLR